MSASSPITIVIADDHAVVRQGFKMILAAQPDMEIVGEAGNGREAVAMVNEVNAQLIWASPRELLNVFQADDIGCHVITATTDVLKKLPLVGKDLHEFSQETVQMFRRDAVKSGYSLPTVKQGVGVVTRR